MSNHVHPLGEVTMSHYAPVLAAGTTTTITTTNAGAVTINGLSYQQAAFTNEAHPTTDANTAAAFTGVAVGKGSIFFYLVDAAGALACVQGSIVDLDTDEATSKFVTAPIFPAIPDGYCPIGYLVVSVRTGGSTWTAATSNQASATGVTYSRKDIYSMPQRLVIA